MSERTAALGTSAPARTIEHNGRVYTIAPVVTEGTMARVEAALYERAKKGLTDLRADMPEAAYLERLDELRNRYEEGYYAFESEHTMEFLQTQKGTLVLLGAMMTADAGEVLDLLTHKPAEVEDALNDAMASSFPAEKAPPPKAKAPRPAKGRRGRG